MWRFSGGFDADKSPSPAQIGQENYRFGPGGSTKRHSSEHAQWDGSPADVVALLRLGARDGTPNGWRAAGGQAGTFEESAKASDATSTVRPARAPDKASGP